VRAPRRLSGSPPRIRLGGANLVRDGQIRAIAPGQQLRVALLTFAPVRSDRVHDPTRRHRKAGSGLGFAGISLS
jgi:hypothetical protein